MNNKLVDLISTKLLTEKITIELDLEQLINTESANSGYDELSDSIISKINELRVNMDNIRLWETITKQADQFPNEGDNNKQ